VKFCRMILVALWAVPALVFGQAKPHVILLTESRGFHHPVTERAQGGHPALVESTFTELAKKTGLFTVECTQNAADLTAEKLQKTQVVIFYTTGILPVDTTMLDAWVKNGGSFMGIHSATDTFHITPEHPDPTYIKMIGGEFDGHPWTQDVTVTFKALDPNNPIAKPYAPETTQQEEVYQQKNFDPKSVRVLIGLDMEKTALKEPLFIPITWIKEYGKGKVLYTEIGHRPEDWTNPKFHEQLTAAISWLTGKIKIDATPNPEVSAKEEEIARKAAAKQSPAVAPKANGYHQKGQKVDYVPPAANAKPAAEPGLPAIVDGFSIHSFVRAPDFHSPSSMAVSADGRVFVSEDEYNSGPDRRPGICRVKMCVDSDGDGKADKITVFADHLNAPQGLTFVGDTLYVVHAPFVSAFRDTNGDGIADERVDLITGLGPAPVDLVHHIPSGIRMGIDGWLYISVGDKGVALATGRDGRKIRFMGGGVVRVRPDGTEMEIFCHGTRNIFDVDVDPYLNTFTRDNTNDGMGWASRLTQMQRDAEIGYCTLFVNFGDEIIQPMADYGGGSGTGGIYVHEPAFPGKFGNSLYTCDWARGVLYRHDLTPAGAGFTVNQENFVTGGLPTDVDFDGRGRMYLCNWDRRGWGASDPAGAVYLIQAKGQPAAPVFPNMKKASRADLLKYLVNPSATWRREAQAELLVRGCDASTISALKEMARDTKQPLWARVAVIFTIAQSQGLNAQEFLASLSADSSVREFALRAMGDRDPVLARTNANIFAAALQDSDPRVRLQAAIAVGRSGRVDLAPHLIAVAADRDPRTAHAGMQALRRLRADQACIAAIHEHKSAGTVAGALRAMREMHTLAAVAAADEFVKHEKEPALRKEAITCLARLYTVEGDWKNDWWMTRPDTTGPNYKPLAWSESPAVGKAMATALHDTDETTARYAIEVAGRCNVKEAAPDLAQIATADSPVRADAVRALIHLKSSTPDVLAALEKVVLSDKFDLDIRGAAISALGSVESAEARAIIIHLIAQLDTAPSVIASLLDRACDIISAHAAPADGIDALSPMLAAKQRSPRIAAATALLRSDNAAAKSRVAELWSQGSAEYLEAVLTAITRIPVDSAKNYHDQILTLLADNRRLVRHAAIAATGHLANPADIKQLIALAGKSSDRDSVALALIELAPEKVPNDEVIPVAQTLADTAAALAGGTNQEDYGKVLSAAQKYLTDARIPKDQATRWITSLKRSGVIVQYNHTEPLPIATGKDGLLEVYPPEQTAGGPFKDFAYGGKTWTWKPITVTDPAGVLEVPMPGNTIEYFNTVIDVPASAHGLLSMGSDDALAAWMNGEKIHTNNTDRSLKADVDQVAVSLHSGPNVLLLKVKNNAGPAGVQARLRWRVGEMEMTELPGLPKRIPGNADRGKALFTSAGCVKCHTVDAHEEPKGPFLGDAGSKLDLKYICESITKPSAKIAQGFQTEHLVTTEGADYTGFLVKQSTDEVTIRDAAGKLTTIAKSKIKSRTPLATSIMPEGLVDGMPLDDFSSLLTYLQSLKTK